MYTNKLLCTNFVPERLLKIYYVDAENIGLNLLGELAISIIDRVFVFTNSEGIKSACTNALLTCISGYPPGQNQADFYIIAHLSNGNPPIFHSAHL